MDQRIGAILILIENKNQVAKLNEILSKHSGIIVARQGLPMRDRSLNVISLVVESSPDALSALTGQVGKLEGVQVKSMMAKQ